MAVAGGVRVDQRFQVPEGTLNADYYFELDACDLILEMKQLHSFRPGETVDAYFSERLRQGKVKQYTDLGNGQIRIDPESLSRSEDEGAGVSISATIVCGPTFEWGDRVCTSVAPAPTLGRSRRWDILGVACSQSTPPPRPRTNLLGRHRAVPAWGTCRRVPFGRSLGASMERRS